MQPLGSNGIVWDHDDPDHRFCVGFPLKKVKDLCTKMRVEHPQSQNLNHVPVRNRGTNLFKSTHGEGPKT